MRNTQRRAKEVSPEKVEVTEGGGEVTKARSNCYKFTSP